MNSRAVDRGARVGAATLDAFNHLVASRPVIPGLSPGDFWAIVGKYMTRGLRVAGSTRPVCDAHLPQKYLPSTGPVTNLDLLKADLMLAGTDSRVALSTVPSVWTGVDFPSCPTCLSMRLSLLHEPVRDSEPSNEFAAVWRSAYLDEHPADYSHIESFAAQMFPFIEFSSHAWGRLGSLEGPASETVSKILAHLAVLNDEAARIWSGEITRDGRESALASHGVTASLEGPKTHKNVAAMKTRDFAFKAGVFRCEWHTKLRPEINRIYFAINDGKVRVGLITDHLPT